MAIEGWLYPVMNQDSYFRVDSGTHVCHIPEEGRHIGRLTRWEYWDDKFHCHLDNDHIDDFLQRLEQWRVNKNLNLLETLQFLEECHLGRDDSYAPRVYIWSENKNPQPVCGVRTVGHLSDYDRAWGAAVRWWVALADQRRWTHFTWRPGCEPLTSMCYNMTVKTAQVADSIRKTMTFTQLITTIMDLPKSERAQQWIAICSPEDDGDTVNLLVAMSIIKLLVWQNQDRYLKHIISVICL